MRYFTVRLEVGWAVASTDTAPLKHHVCEPLVEAAVSTTTRAVKDEGLPRHAEQSTFEVTESSIIS